MRIVGGLLRGRRLRPPASRAIRPTSERLRESMFDILAHRYADVLAGARVIDLFAGSGALGLEALSRGARFALFVDKSAEACALLQANIAALGVGALAQIRRADAAQLGPAPGGAPATLAFLDPPYGEGLAAPALAALAGGGWLAPAALCVVEEAARAKIDAPAGFAVEDERSYADTKIVLLRLRRLEGIAEGSSLA